MKRILSVAALMLAVYGLAAQEDWFWDKPVSAVQWEGIGHADRRALDSLVMPYVGKPFTQDLWTEMQGRIYELDWFDTIDPQAFPANDSRTAVTIKILVKEKPAVRGVKVSGNSGLSSTDILDVVKSKVGDIYNPQTARLDELAVRRLYLEKGYTEAVVSSTASAPGTSGELDLTFVVSEGSKVTVRSLKFSGLVAIGENTIKSQLSLKEAGLFQDGAFQESKLEADKQKIVETYQGRGFVDARITDVVRNYAKDPKTGRGLLDITFVIEEGKPWTLAGVGFEGNRIFGTDKLSQLITQKPDRILNYQRLLADKARIDDLYYESGYIFNSIDLVEARDVEKGSIAYTIKIVERDRAHIESIAFKGNTKSKERVLFRELPLQVGDVFSKAKIVEGLRNLYNLQYFSAIEPEMRPGSAEGLMDLVINVEEQSTADIQFGVTLSGLGDPSAFPVSGLLKWSDKNFLGNGQNFSVELNAALDKQSLTFSFLDNWLLDQRLAGGIDLSFNHTTLTTPQDSIGPIFSDGIPDPFTSYKEYSDAGFQAPGAYSMPYDKFELKLGFNTGYGWTTPIGLLGVGLSLSTSLSSLYYDKEKYRPALADLRYARDNLVMGNKVATRGYINALDNWVNPTIGYYFSEKITLAGVLPFPTETQHYLRSDTRLDGYLTLFSIPIVDQWKIKMVLGGHSGLQALFAQPWASPLAVNPDEALHIDGTFIARGWRDLAGLNGTALWENSVELRMPIFESIVWFDGFLDAATVSTADGRMALSVGSAPSYVPVTAPIAWNNFALSTGFGFRFTIPQFPFRFYFAKRMVFDGTTLQFPNPNFDFVISITQPLN
jgi:outer membrane protein insertion porin family